MPAVNKGDNNPYLKTLSAREKFRDNYWSKRDPIINDRLLWRAQTFRHMVHLLPGQSICELGCGKGMFTNQLFEISRGENPITAVTFQHELPIFEAPFSSIETLAITDISKDLKGRAFNFIIAMDLLDQPTCSYF